MQIASIFISYRRSDCQPHANGLYDGLRNRLASADVFLDTDSLDAGSAWEEAIQKAINRSDVVLVLVGDNWMDKGPDGYRRLDKPGDHVRKEVEMALASSATVIPVLVERAFMPDQEDLPASIAPLTGATAMRLDDDRWRSDVDALAAQIGRITGTRSKSQSTGSEGFELPNRVTNAWLARTVPRLNSEQLEELGRVLQQRRGWTKGEITDYVYELASVSERPTRPPVGDPKKATAFKPPNRITMRWLEDRVPDLSNDEAEALADSMRARGWSEGDIEDWVYANVS